MVSVLEPGERAELDQHHKVVAEGLDRKIRQVRMMLADGEDPVEAVAMLTHLFAKHGAEQVPALLAVALVRMAQERQGS